MVLRSYLSSNTTPQFGYHNDKIRSYYHYS